MACCRLKGYFARQRLLQLDLQVLSGRATSWAEAGACSLGKAAEAFPALHPRELGPCAARLALHPFVLEQRSLKVKTNTDPCSVTTLISQSVCATEQTLAELLPLRLLLTIFPSGTQSFPTMFVKAALGALNAFCFLPVFQARVFR